MDKELEQIHRELNAAERKMRETMKSLDGWADRIMAAITSGTEVNYPRANNGCFGPKKK